MAVLRVKSIRRILLEWIEIRKKTVTRRLQYHLNRIEKRLHTFGRSFNCLSRY